MTNRSRNYRIALILGGLLWIHSGAEASVDWSVESGSVLRFIANQAGADFEGGFDRFDAEIRFAPDDLTGSSFRVEVVIASINTQNDDRDEVLRSPDMFDASRWPKSYFETSAFEHLEGSRYQALGRLTIRDVTRDVVLPFDFEINPGGNEAVLQGRLPIKRLDYGVGQGDLEDTTWVADQVTVIYSLKLQKATR